MPKTKLRKVETIDVTVQGKLFARIVTEEGRRAAARLSLKALRKTAKIGDIISPSGDVWNAERDRSRYPRASRQRARS